MNMEFLMYLPIIFSIALCGPVPDNAEINPIWLGHTSYIVNNEAFIKNYTNYSIYSAKPVRVTFQITSGSTCIQYRGPVVRPRQMIGNYSNQNLFYHKFATTGGDVDILVYTQVWE